MDSTVAWKTVASCGNHGFFHREAMAVGSAQQLRNVARPLVKKRQKDMKKSELAVDHAEKSFEKLRRELKAKRNVVKKARTELLRNAKIIKQDGRAVVKMAQKLRQCFEAQVKKKIKDSLSLKKENGYELPLGKIPILVQNVDPELMDEAG